MLTIAPWPCSSIRDAELMDAQHGSLDVHGEHVVDGLLGDIPPGRLVGHHVADVVDQHVQAAEAAEDLLGHVDDVGVDGDVRLHGEGLAAEILDAGDRLLGSGSAAAVVDGDPSAFLRGADGDLGSVAGSCAGDQDGAAFEAAVRCGALLGHEESLRRGCSGGG